MDENSNTSFLFLVAWVTFPSYGAARKKKCIFTKHPKIHAIF